MSIEEKRREAFEAWFKRDICPSVNYGNPDILRRQLWPAWNAALDSVVIELPRGNMAVDYMVPAEVVSLDVAIAAIEAAGLRVQS